MAKTYTDITAADTFGGWLQRTNDLSSDMTNYVMTVASVSQPNATNGAMASGNTHVEGFFSASVIAVPNEIRGGTISVPTSMKVSSNVSFEANLVTLDSNTFFRTNSNVEFLGSTKAVIVDVGETFFTGANTEFTGLNLVANTTNVVVNANTVVSTSFGSTLFAANHFGIDAVTGTIDIDNLALDAITIASQNVTLNGATNIVNGTALNVNATNVTFDGTTFNVSETANTYFDTGDFRVAGAAATINSTAFTIASPTTITKNLTSSNTVTFSGTTKTFTANTRAIVFDANTFYSDTNANTHFTAGRFDVVAPTINFAGATTLSGTSATISAPAEFTSATPTIMKDSVGDNATFDTINVTGQATLASILITGGSFTGNLRWIDNDQAHFGTDRDLKIYHDGLNSYIDEVGTGSLVMRSDTTMKITSFTSNEDMASFVPNGAVNLYFNNVIKFATTTSGVTISGDVTATNILPTGSVDLVDSARLNLGNSGDAYMYWSGTNARFISSGASYSDAPSHYFRNGAGTETMARFIDNGAVDLYHNNVVKLSTTSTGAAIVGLITSATYTSTGKVTVGTTLDINGTTNLKGTSIHTGTATFNGAANFNSAVDISAALTTNSLIVQGTTDVQGALIANSFDMSDNEKIKLGNSDDLQFYHDGTNSFINEAGTGSLVINSSQLLIKNAANTENVATFIQNAGVTLYYNNASKFAVTNTGSTTTGAATVTTQVLCDDIRNRSGGDLLLSAGESGPILESNVIAGEFVYIAGESGVKVISSSNNWGTSAWANRHEAILVNSSGNSSFPGTVSATQFVGTADNAVLFNGENATNFVRTNVAATRTSNLSFANNKELRFGNSDEAKLEYNGTNFLISYLNASSGNLRLEGRSIQIRSVSGENMAAFTENGDVDLYYNNSRKFSTTNTGISVVGDVSASGDLLSTSDLRLKSNIQPIMNAVHKVSLLNGVTFNMGDDEKRKTGVIAQDMQKALPEAVRENSDGYLTVSYGNTVGLLIEAIKELKAEIEELKGN